MTEPLAADLPAPVEPVGGGQPPTTAWRGTDSWLMLLIVVAAGVLPSLVFGAQFGGHQVLAIVGTTVIVGGAAAASGGLLGFLFGIPRTLQADSAAPADAATYRINTNLEQISDWLTKILVGVGLTQVRQIGTTAGRVVDAVTADYGKGSPGRAVAAGTMLYFLIVGFLAGYVWTRTVLTRTFTRFDAEVLIRRLDSTDAKVSEAVKVSSQAAQISNQAARDVAALAAVDEVLTGNIDASTDTGQQGLDEAVAGASVLVLSQIFARARNLRTTTWHTDAERMARCIPVFRALISCDADRKFYRNYGELGFALKDSDPAQWQPALDSLTTAITIRDERGVPGFWLYDLNRAICRIALAGSPGVPTPPAQRDPIVADLRAAIRNARGSRATCLRLIASECQRWLDQNELRIDDLDHA